MCGIVGSIGYPTDAVNAAVTSMQHRGPDAGGIWQRRNVVLGHRRLSIVDLSANGDQPMVDATGRIAITFNGEIYNFRELKRALRPHYAFTTETDTEVLLAGYLVWGIEDLLRRIRGMYAFGLWDEALQALYLARDPFGKKPLYYTTLGNRIAFASTLNALLGFFDKTPEVNLQAVDDYLTYLAVPGETCIFQGTKKLLPGHYAVFQHGQLAVRKYWHLSFANQLKISEHEAIEELDGLLRRAVKRRLIGDVPIGAFLSGGVDSSLVAALMARESAGPITTLTMGFADERFDERPFARLVSDIYQTHHHERILHRDMWSALPRILHQFGEPFADSSALPTFAVAEFAKQHVTVVLNGDGGDELFAGYTRPLVEAMAWKYRRMLPEFIRKPIGRAAHMRTQLRPRLLNGVKQVLVAGESDARDAFVFDRSIRSLRDVLYTSYFLERLDGHHPDEWYRSVWDQADGPTPVDKVLFGDAMTYLPDELLPKMDAMTMAHALEARSPLLDTDLAEFVARLPYPLKVQGADTKMLLKKIALRYVPEKVLFRPKKGFNMPLAHWLRNELAGRVEALLLSPVATSRNLFRTEQVHSIIAQHVRGQRDYAQELWSLLNLELWFRMYIDKDIRPDDSLEMLEGGVMA